MEATQEELQNIRMAIKEAFNGTDVDPLIGIANTAVGVRIQIDFEVPRRRSKRQGKYVRGYVLTVQNFWRTNVVAAAAMELRFRAEYARNWFDDARDEQAATYWCVRRLMADGVNSDDPRLVRAVKRLLDFV